MGLVYAEIEIANAEELVLAKRHLMDQDEVKKMKIKVMVDSGALMLCINENIQSIMDLPIIRKEKIRLADGQRVEYDVVEDIEIRFGGQKARCEAIVLPGDTRPLLGAIPMEMMNLVIDPQRQELLVSTELIPLVGMTKDDTP